ncbi:MAG: PAS domain S-box protein, partial [Methylocella sp.]
MGLQLKPARAWPRSNCGIRLPGGDVITFDLDRFCRTLAQDAADAIIYADAAGQVVFWNRGAERVFGFSQSEAIGQSLDIIIPEN